jgi:predicted phage terminase large subunit-like protein
MERHAKEIYLAALRSDLRVFVRHSFQWLYRDKQFLDNWHIDAVLYRLEESIEGRLPRLIINLPPRQLKSFIVSIALPAFLLGLDPTAKIICVSYSDELAKALARDFKRIVESDWYRRVFAHVRPIKKTESEFATDLGGSRYATSVGGTLTGRGGDFIIIYDPIKPEDAFSDKARASINEWYRSTLLSRLDDKAKSVLILIMQRLHVNDLTGFVEASGGFHKLALPAIATRDELIPLSDHEAYPRLANEVLHEEREDLATLEAIRDQIGGYNFAAQYQQTPETPEGSLIKRKYIQVVGPSHPMRPGGSHWVSIDSALSTSETADYSALSFGYSNRDGHYVLFAERGRWDFEALLSKALAYRERYPRVTFIVEAAGSGISLIQYLCKRAIPCFWSKPKGDKIARAARTLPTFDAKRVFLVRKPGEDDWVEPYINELVSFPHGRFDDQVDSLVQALSWAEPLVNPGGRVILI